MGLDTVELVMAVEEEFDLEIPDATAEKIFTVGDLHTFVVAELQRRGRTDIDSARSMSSCENSFALSSA
jgi:hypothetical protein